MGRAVGGRFKRAGTYVSLWLIHVDGWQKPTQNCKASILQLKKKFFFLKPKVRILHTQHLGHRVSHWDTGGQRGDKETREAGAACCAKSYSSFVSVPGRPSLMSSASIRERVVGKNIRPSTVISERHTSKVTQSRNMLQAALLHCWWECSWCSHYEKQYGGSSETKNAVAI